MRGTIRRAAGGLAVFALAAGCSSEPALSQVSGTVTFKGQPVPAGWISFTPEPGMGSVRVCQIKDGKYDSKLGGEDGGVHPGKNAVKIAGFDGVKVRLWGQGKQIFNPIDDEWVVPAGASTKDFVVPEAAGKNVKIVPTADE